MTADTMTTMITIHPMPTRLRPLPELKLDLNAPRLRELARTLDRVKIHTDRYDGLCFAVMRDACDLQTAIHFGKAVSRGMNKDAGELDQPGMYMYQYLGEVTIEELTAIRQAWARHIARSIYEQIGD